MKSMSQVLHVADCPETLEEARAMLRDTYDRLQRLHASDTRHRAALTSIRQAGDNCSPAMVWVQKLAAHALEPDRWPHPGPQPL